MEGGDLGGYIRSTGVSIYLPRYLSIYLLMLITKEKQGEGKLIKMTRLPTIEIVLVSVHYL